MSTPLVKFHQVTKTYKSGLFRRQEIAALKGVSLNIESGEVLGLVGPNRAGKTTLIKLLLSLCRPTSGDIERFGQPGYDRRTLARIGYVHENHAFPTYLTATELLEYYGALSLTPYQTLKERIPKLLKKVGIADRAQEPISRFSKGMLQRLGVAQALINDPELLVLDEPTEGLDLLGRQLLRDVARDMKQKKRSVLLVSHVLSEIEELCDRVAVLRDGAVRRVASLSELTGPDNKGKTRSLEEVLQELYVKAS